MSNYTRFENRESNLFLSLISDGWRKPYFSNLSCYCLWHKLHNLKWWTDNSNDTNHPPDFYANHYKLMMDVMQVSEYAITEVRGNKVRRINPAIQDEVFAIQQRAQNGDFPPEGCDVIMVTQQFHPHNYQMWLDDFQRVVQYHNTQIPKYQQNHPGHKTILYVYDDSAAHVVSDRVLSDSERCYGQHMVGQRHCWWRDSNFLNIIYSLDADYVVWYRPHCLTKYSQYNLAVFDLSKRKPQCIKYDIDKVYSVEAECQQVV